ncbi:hypothetical protein BC941DRAFT_433320 [Chlamydoabsidia padenii]|nr:hypothetical protein BC941DRAFT_433320 [Chlamydoabsidia padenii]
MSLSIELEHDSICQLETGCSTITGHLVLAMDPFGPSPHYSACIRLTGKETIKNDDIILLDETYRLDDYYYQDNSYLIPFHLVLPRDLPISFLGENSRIEYCLSATARNLKCGDSELRSMQPLTLIPPPLSPSSSSTCSSQSEVDRVRLFWGMSERHQWQYELELPQVIDTTQPVVFTLRTRMRGFSPFNDTHNSCMIGVQLYESVQMGSSYSGSYRILMTSSRVLSQPSSSWSSPCLFMLDLDQPPLSSTVCSTRIKVTHHLQITLNYCSARGDTDCLRLDCPLALVVPFDKVDEH